MTREIANEHLIQVNSEACRWSAFGLHMGADRSAGFAASARGDVRPHKCAVHRKEGIGRRDGGTSGAPIDAARANFEEPA
jgi:hypothetical protein